MGVTGNYISESLLLVQLLYDVLITRYIQATESFSHVISGGRDKRIVMTELGYAERYTVICEEKAPILKMAMTPDQSSIWVATSESTINNWVNKIFLYYSYDKNICIKRNVNYREKYIYVMF